MIRFIKRVSAFLPARLREKLQKIWHTLRWYSNQFVHYEPEFRLLDQWVSRGDWVLDVGANVGIFTARLSELVGPGGRVLAFEPVPTTFRILVHNSRLFRFPNVSFLNLAVSDVATEVGMDIPDSSTGLPALARAAIVGTSGGVRALATEFSCNMIPNRIGFIKIDVEGHEQQVLAGLWSVIVRDRPRLLIEGQDVGISERLRQIGYRAEIIEASPNTVFHP